MMAHQPFLSIVGVNENGAEGLVPAARAAVEQATLVVGGRRHLDLLSMLINGKTLLWSNPISATFTLIEQHKPGRVAVLASGDPFFFGVGSLLARHIPAHERICYPQPSCVSLACAHLGWAQQDIGVVSLCGRPPASLKAALFDRRRLIVLSADRSSPLQVCTFLREQGLERSTLHVMEHLGGPHERIRSFSAAAALPPDIKDLNLIALEVALSDAAPGRGASLVPGRGESLFMHDGQITKHDVRALTLAALRPQPGQLLWDVGAGSGSVGVEWMLAHPSCRAIAIEPRADRAAHIRHNAQAMGVPSLMLVEGHAPGALEGLPAPDAVFVGGGVSGAGLMEYVWHKLPRGGRLVANAITLEAEAALIAFQQKAGGDLSRIAIQRLSPVGSMQALRPAFPVLQYCATKP